MSELEFVPAREVRPGLRHAAEEALVTFAVDLGLRTLPAIIWTRSGGLGMVEGGPDAEWCVYVDADLAASDVEAIIAHEARHLYQRQRGKWQGPWDTDEAERDAEQYAWQQTGKEVGAPYYQVRYG
jgi:uncharacterized protein YjaZ